MDCRLDLNLDLNSSLNFELLLPVHGRLTDWKWWVLWCYLYFRPHPLPNTNSTYKFFKAITSVSIRGPMIAP